jgi:hypothetical protein
MCCGDFAATSGNNVTFATLSSNIEFGKKRRKDPRLNELLSALQMVYGEKVDSGLAEVFAALSSVAKEKDQN